MCDMSSLDIILDVHEEIICRIFFGQIYSIFYLANFRPLYIMTNGNHGNSAYFVKSTFLRPFSVPF